MYPPSVGDGNVVIIVSAITTQGINVSNGALLWNRADVCTDSIPVVVEGIMYLGSLDGLYALHITNATEVWKFPVFAAMTPAFANGTIVVGSGDRSLYGVVLVATPSASSKSSTLLYVLLAVGAVVLLSVCVLIYKRFRRESGAEKPLEGAINSAITNYGTGSI